MKMFIICFCIIISIFIFACSKTHYKLKYPYRPEKIFYSIDDDFTKEEIKEIIKAAKVLEKCSKNTIKFVFKLKSAKIYDAFWRLNKEQFIYKVRSDSKSWKRKTYDFIMKRYGEGLQYLGVTTVDSGDIFISKTDYCFKQLMIHEFFHALTKNKTHSKNKNSVMYPTISKEQILLKEDIDKLLKEYG